MADPLKYVNETSVIAATYGEDVEIDDFNFDSASDNVPETGSAPECADNHTPKGHADSLSPCIMFSAGLSQSEKPCRQGDLAPMDHLSHVSSPPAVDGQSTAGYANHTITTLASVPNTEVERRIEATVGTPLGGLGVDNIDQPTSEAGEALATRTRAILLRYFVQEISPWFDICDHERHFGQVVPERARTSQTLLNAVCMASIRHLMRSPRHRDMEGIPWWDGYTLPHIEPDTALKYQNECIRDLLAASVDPVQIRNVDLLAACIILRTDEEMEAPCLEDKTDREVFLRVTGAFIEAQAPPAAAVPHSSPYLWQALPLHASDSPGARSDASGPRPRMEATAPPWASNDGELLTTAPACHGVQAEGLRQACFWIALRQELHASFMSQRASNFPLSKFDPFRSFSAANDAVWADRIVIFHADVLHYCYTLWQNASLDDENRRWSDLKNQAKYLESSMPSTFQPIYSQEADPQYGRIFPEVWYLDNCHVTAAAYTELTRILLATFDPTRPKLGIGYLASHREIISTSKNACLKLCGMALGNQQAPPIYLNACAAILLCGEYFEDSTHQDALVWFLSKTEEGIAYPTKDLAGRLKRAWVSAAQES